MEKRAELTCLETGRVFPALEQATRYVGTIEVEYHPSMVSLSQFEIRELLMQQRKRDREEYFVDPVPECPVMRAARLQRFSSYRNEPRFRNLGLDGYRK